MNGESSLSANFNLGTTSIGSLVKSAASLQNEINTYNDDAAAIAYEYSDKTDADFATYQNYLNSRINQLSNTGDITDQTKALTMNSKLVTAQHGNISANVQRASIAVLDGTGTLQDKYNTLVQGYQTLISIGDESGAQSLEATAYSVNQSIQLAAQNAATAAQALKDANATSIDEAVTNQKQIIDSNNAAFSTQGPAYLQKASKTYLSSLGLKTNDAASITSAVAGTVGMVNKGVALDDNSKYAQGTYTPGSILDLYTQAIAADPEKAQTYQDDINGYLNGTTSVSVGGTSISWNGLMNTVYANNNAQAPLTIVKGADGSWSIKSQSITGYTWGTDQNGAPKLMTNYSIFTPTISTQLSNTFKQADINYKTDSNGTAWFQATNKSSWLSKVLGNGPVAGVVQANGSVEFIGANGQYAGKLFVMVPGQKSALQDVSFGKLGNTAFGLQEIGANGKVVDPNVASAPGFKPVQQQTTQTEQSNSIALAGTKGTFTNPDTISIGGAKPTQSTTGLKDNTKGLFGNESAVPGLGNTNIFNIMAVSQNLNRINAQHNATMQAVAPLNFVPPPPAITPNTAPAPSIKINTNSASLNNKPVGTPPAAGTKVLIPGISNAGNNAAGVGALQGGGGGIPL